MIADYWSQFVNEKVPDVITFNDEKKVEALQMICIEAMCTQYKNRGQWKPFELFNLLASGINKSNNIFYILIIIA